MPSEKPTKPEVPLAVRKAEAASLALLFKDRGISQSQFGLDNDIGNQSMVSQYLTGKRPLNVASAIAFARGIGVRIDDFSPRLADLIRDAAPFLNPSGAEGVEPETDFILRFLTRADPIARGKLQAYAQGLQSGKEAEHASSKPPSPPKKRPIGKTREKGGNRKTRAA